MQLNTRGRDHCEEELRQRWSPVQLCAVSLEGDSSESAGKQLILPPQTPFSAGNTLPHRALLQSHIPGGMQELFTPWCHLHYSFTKMPPSRGNLDSASVWKLPGCTRTDQGTPQITFLMDTEVFHQQIQFTRDRRAQFRKDEAFKHALKALSPATSTLLTFSHAASPL